jgi:hypothetical protein
MGAVAVHLHRKMQRMRSSVLSHLEPFQYMGVR